MAKYRQQSFSCGDYLQVRFLTVAPTRRARGRRPAMRPTKASQAWINQRHKQDKLCRLLNANFRPDDVLLALTYAPGCQPEDADGVIRDVQKYMRKVKAEYARAGLPRPKYIWVPEGDGVTVRFHIHVTISGGLPRERLEAIWGEVIRLEDSDVGSIAFSKPLRFNKGGIEALAKYVTKESRGDLDQMEVDPETGEIVGKRAPVFKKAWYASVGLVNPQAETRVVAQKEVVDLCTVEAGNREPLERRFPGYVLSEARPYYDEASGLWYLYASMYKAGSFMSRVRKEEAREREAGRSQSAVLVEKRARGRGRERSPG